MFMGALRKGDLMKRIIDLVKFGIVAPALFWLAMFPLFKTQRIGENKIRKYNYKVRWGLI